MNWVDACVIAVIAVSALLAFARGFVREALGIGAWVGAGLLAIWAYPFVQPRMLAWLANPDLADPAALGAVFLVALVFLSVIAGMAGSLVRISLLGGLDRTLGLVFGLLRGAVLVAAAYIGLGMVAVPDSWPPPLRQARSLPVAYRGAVLLARLLPTGYRPAVPPPPATPQTRAEDLMQPQPQGRATAQP